MKDLKYLFDQNAKWSDKMKTLDEHFFDKLVDQQTPEYLWIGCSDSRVPANEIVGLLPGELFVHRNVANVVIHTDFNCLSVLQYAIEILKVKHVIICGHYGCGGVKAALDSKPYGLIDNWLHGIKNIYKRNQHKLESLKTEQEKLDKMCELNVIQQMHNICYTSIVQDAWHRGQSLSIHGWIYDIKDGVLKNLGVTVDGPDQIAPIYRLTDEDDE
ncbi:MAG: carbonate dehydratase [Gammaproteobacteria bacterium]|nr:carbonate dehydratase [Gammaproteobacteria bacterium]